MSKARNHSLSHLVGVENGLSKLSFVHCFVRRDERYPGRVSLIFPSVIFIFHGCDQVRSIFVALLSCR